MLGVDIGGSGIKAAVVDSRTGTFVGERRRIPTPQPATPKAVARAVGRLIDHFEWKRAVGVGLPAVVLDGVVRTAANIDDAWIDTSTAKLFKSVTKKRVHALNDADAAGLAEIRFGAGRGVSGVVLMVTLGTGIGSAVFVDGKLVPNTEFGHMEVEGNIAEKWASDGVRDRKDLSWERWGRRLGTVLSAYDRLLWPNRIILGGGVSKRASRFLPFVETRAEVVVAELRNHAGIIGAATHAAEQED